MASNWVDFGTLRTVTANYTVVASDSTVLVDATAGAVAITLPTASSVAGMKLRVSKIDASANAVTFVPAAGDSIRSTDVAQLTMTVRDDDLVLLSDGIVTWRAVTAEDLPSVFLQSSTPGSPQTGHSNVSGTSLAGFFSGDGASVTNLNATNLATGTVADARLTANVTKQGNTFNGLSQLVQTDPTGKLPAINGSLVTNVNAALLNGTTLAAPGEIGATTPAVVNATAVKVGALQVVGAQQPAVADVVATGVVTPANAAYTQADQTALANAVIELKTQLNALLARVRTHGTIAP